MILDKINKLRNTTREDRLKDPEVQKALTEEYDRVKDSFFKLSEEYHESGSKLLCNIVWRPLVAVHRGLSDKKKDKDFSFGLDMAENVLSSPILAGKIAWRVLAGTGRLASYGVRRGLAI